MKSPGAASSAMDWLRRHASRWTGSQAPETPPPLSTTFAVILSVGFTVLYVAPFYLSATTRPSRTIFRDSPTVIKARVRAVLLSCSLSTIATVCTLAGPGKLPFHDILRLLGIYPISLSSIGRSLCLLATLYAAPLYEGLIVEEAWRDYVSNPRLLLAHLSSPTGFRNYVAGPFTEELLFRSLLIPLNLLTPQVTKLSTGLAGTHARIVLFTTPLYFGVAHVHHLYEFRLTHPHVPFSMALFQTVFQLCFTTVFGWYTAFVFLRTGSLWACFLTHSFCNWMGLPRVWGKLERPQRQIANPNAGTGITPKAPVAMGPPKDEPGVRGLDEGADRNGNGVGRTSRARKSSYVRTRSNKTPQEAQQSESILWTVAYYVILVAGIVGFYKGLWPMTESSGQLAEI